MPNLTVDPDELKARAKYAIDAAASAGRGVDATANVHLTDLMWRTHGVASQVSNKTIIHQRDAREDLGRKIQEACLKAAEVLKVVAAIYAETDVDAADNLNNQMRS